MALATRLLEAPVAPLGPSDAVRWPRMSQERAGDRVRRYRRMRGLTQAQLAESAGTDRGYVGKLEAGDIDEPSVDVVTRLARALEVPVRAIADPRLYDTADESWEAVLLADTRFSDEEKQAIILLGRAALSAKQKSA